MDPRADSATNLRSLGERETQALRLSGEGKTSEQIAHLLALSPTTALLQKAVIYDKLGLTSLPQDARLRELTRLSGLERQSGIDPARADGPQAEPAEPTPEAIAAVQADDMLLGGDGAAVAPADATVTEQRTVRFDTPPPATTRIDSFYEPAPVVPGPRPAPWGIGPGPLVAILAAAIVLIAILVFLFARGSQPAPVASPTVVVPAAAPATPIPAQTVAAPTPPTPALATPAATGPSVAAAGSPSAAAGAASLPVLAPIPTSTAFPIFRGTANTPPGTTLNVGQPWRESALELTLAAAQASPGGLSMNFLLSSSRPSALPLRFSREQVFSATDNTNRSLVLVDPNFNYNFTLQPNTTAIFDSAHEGGPISFLGNLTDPRVTSVTVTVSGLGGINNARWQIPIQR
jgi:DNA-binding CsgD family transcriptional regulator